MPCSVPHGELVAYQLLSLTEGVKGILMGACHLVHLPQLQQAGQVQPCHLPVAHPLQPYLPPQRRLLSILPCHAVIAIVHLSWVRSIWRCAR